eukprot:1368311-Pleurochrysis_carterae.AAC.1
MKKRCATSASTTLHHCILELKGGACKGIQPDPSKSTKKPCTLPHARMCAPSTYLCQHRMKACVKR